MRGACGQEGVREGEGLRARRVLGGSWAGQGASGRCAGTCRAGRLVQGGRVRGGGKLAVAGWRGRASCAYILALLLALPALHLALLRKRHEFLAQRAVCRQGELV